MGFAFGDELGVLHGGEEFLEPPEGGAVPGRVELIPEDERDLALDGSVAHLMEGFVEVFEPGELGEIELEDGFCFAKEGFGELFDGEGFSGSGGAEDGEGERPGIGAAPLVVEDHVPDRVEALDLLAVDGEEFSAFEVGDFAEDFVFAEADDLLGGDGEELFADPEGIGEEGRFRQQVAGDRGSARRGGGGRRRCGIFFRVRDGW